jgi:ribose transport system permease protein
MSISATASQPAPLGQRIKRFMSDYPLVPLIALLLLLVLVLQIMQPGIVNQRWIANTVKFAIPLALLAGCQTMTMLTGGIDLSVGTVATMAAFIVATQGVDHAAPVAMAIALVPAVLIGFANGIGVGVFRVHPLIMTLGTSLIGVGFLQVYQRTVIAAGAKVPDFLIWLGTGVTSIQFTVIWPQFSISSGINWSRPEITIGLPHALLLFIPIAALLIFIQRRTGFGRLLYAIGDNERATRLAGVKYWQVILALYMFSSVLAGIMGLLYMGLIRAPSLSLAEPLVLPSVAAAVIGGTSIFGGRGSYTGTIVGALILTVLTTLLTILQMPEGARRILFGAIVLLVTAAYLRIVDDR